MNIPIFNRKVATHLFSSQILRLSLAFLFLFFLLSPVLDRVISAQGTPEADEPDTHLLQNADFESGNTSWQFLAGGGIEDCCGQHETPFWGRQTSPYPAGAMFYLQDNWDGYILPNGQFSRIYRG